MKSTIPIILFIAMAFSACQNSGKQKSGNVPEHSSVSQDQDEILAIDILLDPDSTMLNISKIYNDRLRENYPEGFELDASHRPHITVIQAFVKTADLTHIKNDLEKLMSHSNLSDMEFVADGLYYIPYEDKGLAGITVEKQNLMEFHNQVVDLMKKYTVADGQGTAFVPRPDGNPIMAATVDYVNGFVASSSGEKYNPHVTIGTAFKPFVENLLAEEFSTFSFKVRSVSIYQLGELGTAQKKLVALEL